MRGIVLTLGLALSALPASAQVADLRSTTQFRVCADPANAPMSVRDGSGFENRLAQAFGEWLGRPGIAEGESADLVVYRDDPRQDVRALADPHRVILRGRAY